MIFPTVLSLLVSCGARSLYNSSHYGDTSLGTTSFGLLSGVVSIRCPESFAFFVAPSFAGNRDTPTLRSWTRRQEVPCAMLHRSIPFIVTIIRTILFFRHSFCRQDDPVAQFSFGRWLCLRGSRNRGFAQKEVRNNRMNIFLSRCS